MNLLALLPNLAGPDMLIIFFIVLIMFGAKKLPELAKGLGQAVKEFSKAKEDVSQEFNRAVHYDDHSHQSAPVAPPQVQAPVPQAPAAQTAHVAPSEQKPQV